MSKDIKILCQRFKNFTYLLKDMPKFVIHKHAARNLHYDFRLEMDNVLKSWAIPKEPNDKDKRLSIQVEDHPLGYANFEGTIPKGEYGAGKVEIWDKGNYELESKKKEKIVFVLHGKKLKGRFCLLRFKKVDKGWLFFKIKDEKEKKD